jgi:hypothetical protein
MIETFRESSRLSRLSAGHGGFRSYEALNAQGHLCLPHFSNSRPDNRRRSKSLSRTTAACALSTTVLHYWISPHVDETARVKRDVARRCETKRFSRDRDSRREFSNHVQHCQHRDDATALADTRYLGFALQSQRDAHISNRKWQIPGVSVAPSSQGSIAAHCVFRLYQRLMPQGHLCLRPFSNCRRDNCRPSKSRCGIIAASARYLPQFCIGRPYRLQTRLLE